MMMEKVGLVMMQIFLTFNLFIPSHILKIYEGTKVVPTKMSIFFNNECARLHGE